MSASACRPSRRSAISTTSAAAESARQDQPRGSADGLVVWIDQDLCTGDGLCVQYARPVFEMDLDGLAYVKDAADELLTDPGARTPVPLDLIDDVLASAKECPGKCIHVEDAATGAAVAGPRATSA
jgi:ferredoxin